MLEAVREALNEARKAIPVGSVWLHKKGGTYMVIGAGYDTENGRANIHYYRIAGPDFNEQAEIGIVFDRPRFMWTPDRFTKVNPFHG